MILGMMTSTLYEMWCCSLPKWEDRFLGCRATCRPIISDGTLPSRTKERMGKTMIDMSNVGNAKSDGLQKQDFKRLRPWEVAVKLLPIENGPPVDVEHATDEQFHRFITSLQGLPINEAGIDGWSFDDRCRTINHALKYGLIVPFVEPENKSDEEQKELTNNSDSELFEDDEEAQGAIDLLLAVSEQGALGPDGALKKGDV